MNRRDEVMLTLFITGSVNAVLKQVWAQHVGFAVVWQSIPTAGTGIEAAQAMMKGPQWQYKRCATRREADHQCFVVRQRHPEGVVVFTSGEPDDPPPPPVQLEMPTV